MTSEIFIRRAEFNDLDTIYGFICELENEKFNFDDFRAIFDKNFGIFFIQQVVMGKRIKTTA